MFDFVNPSGTKELIRVINLRRPNKKKYFDLILSSLNKRIYFFTSAKNDIFNEGLHEYIVYHYYFMPLMREAEKKVFLLMAGLSNDH